MPLQFVVGGSGYGKSRYVYDKVIEQSMADADYNYYFIVPEQYTVQTEKDIIKLHPNKGIMNIDVLSFRRMAYRVFEETGRRQLPLLDDTGKNLVLRKVIEESKDKLLLYKNKVKMPGFVEQVKSVIAELYQYGIGKDELGKMLETAKSHPLLHTKLSDIALIREQFQKYIEEQYITSEELLEVLACELAKSAKFRDSVVVLDGFTGFTPVQYKVIQALLMQAGDVIVTVTADVTENLYEGELRETLFGLGKTTVHKLTELAKTSGVTKCEDIVLNEVSKSRFSEEEALRFLEMHLFRGHKAVYEKETDAVRISEHLNMRKEAEYVAGRVLSLVRDEGYFFRDIAVVTGALESYREPLEEAFAACGIPCFTDYKLRLMGNPLVEIIRSLFEISRTDYSFESIFTLLKTGLSDLSEEEINLLENYCATYGVRGKKRWSSVWKRKNEAESEENDRINNLRDRVITVLLPVTEVLGDSGKTIREKMTAIYALLVNDEFRCQEKMEALRIKFEEQGESELANEYKQAYKLVMELFDKVVGLLGDERIKTEELAGIMDSGFEELKIGIIPPSVDQVLIGDIQRSRLGDVKCLFFVGVNDGIVPSDGKSGGIISENERNFLTAENFELAPTARHNIFIQRYYLYLNLTKPSKLINLSYSLMGSSGDSLKPSVIVKQLNRMFPAVLVKKESVLKGFDADVITTPDGSMGFFIEGLSDESMPVVDVKRAEGFEELFAWYLRQPDRKEKIDKLISAAFFANTESKIAKQVAASLYGPQPISSVTRLEQFAKCGYAHFLSYGLKLKEREEYEVTYLDLGNLFHYAIEEYAKKIHEYGLEWKDISDEQNDRIVDEVADRISDEYKEAVLDSSARNAYLRNRLKRITKRTVWALREQLKRGDFVPLGNEVAFSGDDELSALNIELSVGKSLKLRGRIDRMDVYEDEDNIYLKIVDYKSGSTKFDLSAAYYGLQIQLLIYMEAARESVARANPDKNVIPAGMFYYNIADALVEDAGETDEEREENLLKQLRVNGLVNRSADSIEHLDKNIQKDSSVIPIVKNKDGSLAAKSQVITDGEYVALINHLKGKIKDIGTGILEGDISINPYETGAKTGCDYCTYKSICGFDKDIKGYKFRKLKSLKADEVWAKIQGGEQDGDSLDRETE